VGTLPLRPLTGKRHQLRVHMAALGLPILGDRIYPTLLRPGETRAPSR
jgi:tRNA pseudouridine32 synthase / 23S rRNA pseudouridine746 synthase